MTSRLPIRESAWIGAIYFLPAIMAIGAGSDSLVTVRTIHEHSFTGRVDARTDGHQLWIRRETERIILATPIRWSAVASATVNGKQVELSVLRETAAQMATAGPVRFLSGSIIETLVHRDGPDSEQTWPAPNARSRVVRIEAAAHLVNLDRDVEPDGIEVAIAAVDRRGLRFPVRGNLYARLVAERTNHHTGRSRVEDVQRWARSVKIADFLDAGALYQLPFRTIEPELELGLSNHGILNLRLTVAGQGNFEASVPVALRHFDPFRDSLQLKTGSRFHHSEFTRNARRGRASRAGNGPVWFPEQSIRIHTQH